MKVVDSSAGKVMVILSRNCQRTIFTVCVEKGKFLTVHGMRHYYTAARKQFMTIPQISTLPSAAIMVAKLMELRFDIVRLFSSLQIWVARNITSSLILKNGRSTIFIRTIM